MGNTQPFISIGLPVHNGENVLERALDSLLAQDYDNFELIISDNASTDRTPEICLEYAACDPRVRYERSDEFIWATGNFNRAFGFCRGEFFMFASHNQCWKPDFIRRCLEGFKASGRLVLVSTMCESVDPLHEEVLFVDRGFSTVGLSPAKRLICYKSEIHTGRHIGGMFYGIYKTDAIRRAMPMRQVIANDQLFLTQLCLEGEFLTIPETLMLKRAGGMSKSIRCIAEGEEITNIFLIAFPYLVREALLQKMIFQACQLNMRDKIALSIWSWGDYFHLWIRFRYRAVRDSLRSLLTDRFARSEAVRG